MKRNFSIPLDLCTVHRVLYGPDRPVLLLIQGEIFRASQVDLAWGEHGCMVRIQQRDREDLAAFQFYLAGTV